MVRNRRSADMEVKMRHRAGLHLPAVSLTYAVALTLWLGSFGADAGFQTGAPTVLSLRSVPDGLNVYVARAGQPDTIFNQGNFKGQTPLTLQVEAGEYQLGYLATKALAPSQLGAIEEIQPGVRVVSLYRDATLIQYPDKVITLASGSREIAVPNRTSLKPSETEPYAWDRSPVTASGPEEFNAFYYKIDGTDIAQVGTIYTVHASQAQNEHIGIILPSRYLRAGERIQELRQYYPQERRFKLPPASEVDAVLKASGILEYRDVLVELLERGGKVIYDGPRPGGSVNLKSGEQVPVVHAAQDAAPSPSTTMRLRDVLSIRGGKLVATRYGTSVHQE
jgi:hypothetical protein